jgi:hypothetical protein
MASVIPDKDLEMIQFFETHWPIWTTAPTTIGLTAGQVTNLKNATESSRAKYSSQQTAKTAAKASTNALHSANSSLRDLGSALIAAIKAYAETTNNPGVYDIAQIPMPDPASPAPLPKQPDSITITLEPGGALTLKWKSNNSAGAYFTIARMIGDSGTFVTIGNAQKKTFTDGTLPLGSSSATYIITGVRGSRIGDSSEPVQVQFGVGSGGGLQIASVNGGLKVAA